MRHAAPMALKIIDHIDYPELQLYSSLRQDDNFIVCDSEKVVLKLLKSNLKIISLLGHEKFFAKHPQLKEQYNCYQAPKAVLEQIVGHRLHQSVMAIAQRPDYTSSSQLRGPICILNGVSSPENVGNIIRSLTAFNIRSLLIDHQTASPYLRRAIRVSMGNIFRINIAHTYDLITDLNHLKKCQYQIIATANHEQATTIHDLKFKPQTAFIIGSEGHGIASAIYPHCDLTAFIPITEDVLHLNAANAATIFSYEISKQLKLVTSPS